MRTDIMVPLNRQIVKDIQNELRLQGHYDTGFLESSFKPIEKLEGQMLVVEAFAAAYIEELENGVPAGQINITPQEFENLVQWVRRKIRGTFTDPRTIAGLIVEKWKREGKPLESSKAYSQTGQITGAIKGTFERNEQDYFKRMDEAVENQLDFPLFKKAIETI